MKLRTLVVAASAVAGSLLMCKSAVADSPAISVFVSGIERCQATYYSSGTDHFDMADMNADGRYCYIQYDWDSNVDSGGSRFSQPTDYSIGTAIAYYPTVSGHSTIWWKLCREVPSSPDNCTSVRSDTTSP